MSTSADARPGWLRPLAAALASPDRVERVVALRPGVGGRAAAVLCLVAAGADGPEVLFVERAATLRTHAGQIAFPGGAADPGDVDLVDTALREAEEEVGVRRGDVDVLGLLPPAHVAVSGFDVTAVVGWWRDRTRVGAVDAREVASVPVVPVSVLTDPARRASVRHPSGYTGPAFEVEGHLIWGLTAHLLDGVLDLAGWQRPWDRSRQVAIPARYLTSRPVPDRPEPGGPDAH
ncbi:NUDIX domain-containing protein [Friedmanniella luteola]|uniref:NUDIX domain-containing protein n=1 Tax=Friedmanniella luteola TaxID=546871 RepID=A0A1H1LEZ7_9ACTN|nr:CoA pyrophosphatase [Friedmanniella luteola]SDR73108.1 NUDIX domain-containing protein [Friedmanniella luteola]